MTVVHTAHGQGTIVKESIERGKKSFLVEGKNFSMWVPESELEVDVTRRDAVRVAASEVNYNNSTTLPYNPNPQFPHSMFSNESTIQPNHVLDIGEAKRPTDSVTFKGREKPAGPGPNPDLFREPLIAPENSYEHPIGDYESTMFENEDEFRDTNWDHEEDPGDYFKNHPNTKSSSTLPLEQDEADDLLDEPEETEPTFFNPKEKADQTRQKMDEFGDVADQWNWKRHNSTDPNSESFQFHASPLDFLNRKASILESNTGLDPDIGEYQLVVEADRVIREAAWKDVRSKALRLRREGKIEVKEINPEAILARVEGDHGTYDTQIIRGNIFDLGGQSVTAWSCSCEWGKWAFKRKRTLVGRLCSHGYAAYLELQSANNKGKPQWKKTKSGATPQHDFHAPEDQDYGRYDNYGVEQPDDEWENPQDALEEYRRNKHADTLHTDVENLDIEFNYIPYDPEYQQDVDVEEDERVTTGPEGMILESGYIEDTVEEMSTAHNEQSGKSDDQLLEQLQDVSRDPGGYSGDFEDRTDLVQDTVQELKARGYDADFLVAMVKETAGYPVNDLGHDAFAGSGPDPKDEWESSLDIPHDEYDDVTNLNDSDEDITRFLDEVEKTSGAMVPSQTDPSSVTPELDLSNQFDTMDPTSINTSTPDTGNSFSGTQMAKVDEGTRKRSLAFLKRMSGRYFTPQQQEELIEESHPEGARNLNALNLAGTHYLD